jgi:hypothetical protein
MVNGSVEKYLLSFQVENYFEYWSFFDQKFQIYEY